MSNFGSFGLVTDGLPGTAPQAFVASTPDSYALITAPGYMNDQSHRIKANDKVAVNYNDTSAFPLNIGESAILVDLIVQFDPTSGDYSLVPPAAASNDVISSLGVHSAVYNNAGGSATVTFSDASITPSSIVIARWKSSDNDVIVETVLAGNGTLTVVSNTDPGASVLEYISAIPSVALQTAGVIAAKATVTGATTTIVISNPLITSTSVVNANFISQTNAAVILTVTPAAGTITIVTDTAAGASTVAYQASTPSSALTADGFYSAQYINAGGSSTTTISDANI